MKPKKIAFTPETTTDPTTGRNVVRISQPPVLSTHAYFTSTSNDSQGRWILSMQVDGKVQLCRVDLAMGTCFQLTDLPDVKPQSYCVDPARDQAMLIQGRDLLRIDMTTGQVQAVFSAPQGYRLHTPTVDASGQYAAFAVTEELPVFNTSQAIYSRMPEQFYARLRSLIVRLDLESLEARVIWGENRWLSHVLIHPRDPETIVFCHEGGHLVDHRLWAVSARPLHKKKPRCLFEESRNHFLVHEFFCPDGNLGVQMSLWPEDHQEMPFDDPRSRHGVLFLDMQGNIVAEYAHPAKASMHVQAGGDRSCIVADTFSASWDKPADEGHLSLLTPDENNVLRAQALCRHDTSWQTQLSHPHPRFADDGQSVVFTTDAGGTPSACVVDL